MVCVCVCVVCGVCVCVVCEIKQPQRGGLGPGLAVRTHKKNPGALTSTTIIHQHRNKEMRNVEKPKEKKTIREN